MALKENDYMQRLNDFFVKNWWFNGVSNIIIIILLVYYIVDIKDFKKETTDRINIATQHIIYGTEDGRVALLDRKPVNTDSKVFQNYIAIIAKNMEASESTLTHGFDSTTSSKIISPASLVNVDENFALLYKEFFVSKRVTMSFLRYYYNLLKSGQIAKKSSILETNYDYQGDGKGGFTMKIIFKTAKDFINKVDNKPIELIANDTILIKGFIDPTKYSTSLNPYGVKITDVKLNIYTYGDYIKSRN